MINFNKPFLTGKEAHYMYQAVFNGKLSGNGDFTKKCEFYFENHYGFKKAILTTSCSDALEMAAILCDIKPGDEVIVPSYTFVSSALAFVREGAHIIFADSYSNNPNIDPAKLEGLITDRTKVIVPVHYAGIACDMDKILEIAHKHNILVVEDNAQGLDSFYKGKPLGTLGDLGCISFHETKNITAGGEGGLLIVNNERFIRRAEIIWEKGTNRAEFFRGMVNKYGWVDTGSSFLPSEINAAFLLAQLEELPNIQDRRKKIWSLYKNGLSQLETLGYIKLPHIPDYATNNAHMFYLVCRNLEERTSLISFMKENEIQACFHYLSLHKSQYYLENYQERPKLENCDHFADCLVRLPMYFELRDEEIVFIIEKIKTFFQNR